MCNSHILQCTYMLSTLYFDFNIRYTQSKSVVENFFCYISIENLKAVKNMCVLNFLNPFFRSKNLKNSEGIENR